MISGFKVHEVTAPLLARGRPASGNGPRGELPALSLPIFFPAVDRICARCLPRQDG
jgi:hypothetical protein